LHFVVLQPLTRLEFHALDVNRTEGKLVFSLRRDPCQTKPQLHRCFAPVILYFVGHNLIGSSGTNPGAGQRIGKCGIS
jgi:hypothetical protein